MEMEEFCLKLQDLYLQMGQTFSEAQLRSGLFCPPGCGQCCTAPTVEASVLEMLPMALELYTQGRAEEMYEQLSISAPETCMVYRPHSADRSLGQCTMYHQRPSVCRMFAVAGVRKKDESATLSICKKLKDGAPEKAQEITLRIEELQIPFLSDWSMKLFNLDPDLINKRLRISMALCKALEKVLYYYDLKSR